MTLPSYFIDFLSNIRLSKSQIDDLIMGHTTLRKRLNDDPELSKIIVSTFLQGSYRRSTAIKPKNGKRADVDIIVVTNLDRQTVTAQEAINKFIPFVEKHYKGKYEPQGRSIGIELSYVDLDVVVTSAPSEVDQKLLKSESVTTNLDLMDVSNDWRLITDWVEPTHRYGWNSVKLEAVRAAAEWKTDPLWIPDHEANEWSKTHPLEQIRWTRDKNKETNGHYVNVVKSIKWYRTLNLTSLKYPKGYPVEHMVGDCCPDGIQSVGEGIVKTLEAIISKFAVHRELEQTPSLKDRGVPDHNVWHRVSSEDFVAFYDFVKEAALTARKAYDATTVKESADAWRLLFGSEFPPAPAEKQSSSASSNGGYSERSAVTTVAGGRFA